MNVTFRGGYVEDESGARWWSAELLAQVEKERDEARELLYDAYQTGAEDMRERCAQWVADFCSAGKAEAIRAIPIPETHGGAL